MSEESYMKYTEAFTLAIDGELDINSPDWGLKNNNNGIVAHLAAFHNRLPPGFVETYRDTLFIHPDDYDWTPAHHYVTYEQLPLEFPHWGVKNKFGNTIAYIAAMNNKLPPGFYDRYRDSLFIQPNDTGWTIAHEYAATNKIPLCFPHWGLMDKSNGDTIAHVAAECRTLPEGFADEYPKIWHMKNNNGETVEDLAYEKNYKICKPSIPCY